MPSHLKAQTQWRMAFVLVCADVTACDPAALAFAEAQRVAWPTTYSAATRGLATVDTAL